MTYYSDGDVTLHHGHALDVARTLPSGLARTIVTSPPYFGLRDYGHDDQLGAEATVDAYVGNLVTLFRELRRVLADDGTLWLNLGDSYSLGDGAKTRGTQSGQTWENGVRVRRPAGAQPSDYRTQTTQTFEGMPAAKNLLGVPWRVARALQEPYYVGKIRSVADRAWLAGWIDGEGTISYVERDRGPDHTPTHDVRVYVTNTDPEPLNYFGVLCGGRVFIHDDGTRENRLGKRPCYRWQMGTHESALVLREVYPYLRTKRRQAALIWTLFTTLRHQNGHARTPSIVVAKRRAIAAMVRTLNSGGDVTLPDWVEEPPSPEEPGWILRSDIIWAKPNPMPESVTDRPTKAHEYVFLLSKSPRYYYDADAIAEPFADDRMGVSGARVSKFSNGAAMRADGGVTRPPTKELRNRRSVWEVPTAPFPGAHFAVYPPELIRPCILAGSAPGDTVLDPFSGSGTTGMVAGFEGRRYVGIDVNADYLDLSIRTRFAQPTLGIEAVS